MGQQDLALQGYPRSTLKNDWTLSFLCGGKGGGSIVYAQTQTFCKFAIDVNPFITKNRELTLNNSQVTIYSDAGGITPVTWYLGLSAVSTLTGPQILAQNNPFGGFSGYNMEILRLKLPQPTDSGWASKIWVYIYWGSTSLYGDAVYVDNSQYLTPVKHDFDVRQ